ncbi:hypothetical protein ACFSTC_26365 [Nonomuraea ferruginea]
MFLAARVPLGLLGALVLVLLVFGAWQAGQLAWAWVLDEAYDGMSRSVPLGLYTFTLGGVLLFLALTGLAGGARAGAAAGRSDAGPRPYRGAGAPDRPAVGEPGRHRGGGRLRAAPDRA